MTASRRFGAEFIGTASLLCAVIGSGIMAENLAGGNVAIALLANTFATVFALYVLIETLGPISGAHFNPAVSIVLAYQRKLSRHHLLGYIVAQLAGAVVGAWLAHAMFGLEIVQFSAKVRTGAGQWMAEAVATAGLLFVILRSPAGKASTLVAGYIGSAYWFTASTSFANPAAAIGRMFTNTFAGISPADVPLFVVSQLVGAVLGYLMHQAFARTVLDSN
jgi:glycerol uptake facilitator-like aquaporin